MAAVSGNPPISAESAPLVLDLRAAGAGALVLLGNVLAQAVLVYAALGPAGVALGLLGALLSTALGTLWMVLLARGPLRAAGPSSATSVILAALVVQVLNRPDWVPPGPGATLAVLRLVGAAVVVMGLVQLAISALGLARLARYVPQPVLAGFMNGVAVLILVSQLPAMLGWTAQTWQVQGLAAWRSVQPAALLLAVATVGSSVFVQRRWPACPAAPVGLAIGGLGTLALAAAWPGAIATLPTLGSAVATLPGLQALSLWQVPPPLGAWEPVLITGVLLALVGSLESVLNLAALDQNNGTNTDVDRSLRTVALGNLTSGLLGGLPVVSLRSAAHVLGQAGGRGGRPALLAVMLLIAAVALGGAALAQLPRAVLGGMMVMVAVALADHWTRSVARQWWSGDRGGVARGSLVVVAVVCVAMLTFGIAVAVALGVLLSMLSFIQAMNRSLVRARWTGAERPSRRIWGSEQEAHLARHRHRIVLLELEGALFFGSAERLRSEVEGLPSDSVTLVLDIRRVSTIDASGAVMLATLASRHRARQSRLLLSGLAPDDRHARALVAFATVAALPPADWYDDADHATEAAERQLLASAAIAEAPAVGLASGDLLRGLSGTQREAVIARLQHTSLRAGELLFQRGDPGDRLYVLIAGSISIVSPPDTSGRRQRFVSFSPGRMFGELAVLDGGGRTADAVADADSQVASLAREALAELRAVDPELAAAVYNNMAIHLSERLRAAAAAWHGAA